MIYIISGIISSNPGILNDLVEENWKDDFSGSSVRAPIRGSAWNLRNCKTCIYP